MERAADPVGSVPVGGEGYRRGARVCAHQEGGVQGSQKSTSRGGGGGERGGGGPRPALDCTFRLSFLSAVGETGFFLFLPLLFLLECRNAGSVRECRFENIASECRFKMQARK